MLKSTSFFTIFLFMLYSFGVSPLNAQTLTERGILTSAEDGGYPMFVVTIEFPERNFSETFSLNIEEMQNVDAGKLSSWVGKYVSFTYTSVERYYSII